MEYDGDIANIIDSVLCATIDDESRFTTILKDLITKEELPKLDKFTIQSKSKKKSRQKKVPLVADIYCINTCTTGMFLISVTRHTQFWQFYATYFAVLAGKQLS